MSILLRVKTRLVVVHTGKHSRTMLQAGPRQKYETLSEKQPKAKRAEGVLK
jgi:hypothetical protein